MSPMSWLNPQRLTPPESTAGAIAYKIKLNYAERRNWGPSGLLNLESRSSKQLAEREQSVLNFLPRGVRSVAKQLALAFIFGSDSFGEILWRK